MTSAAAIYKAQAQTKQPQIRKQANGLPDPDQVYEQRRREALASGMRSHRHELLTSLVLGEQDQPTD